MLLLNILHDEKDTHFLPLTFNLRSLSNALTLSLKITTSFLVTLRDILFALTQYKRLFRSLLADLLISFIDCFALSKQVSSAKWNVVEFLMAKYKSLIKIRKINGQRTGP